MSVLPTPPTGGRTAIRVVLIAGAGPSALAVATDLLDRLPELRSPVIVGLRDVDLGPLEARLDGERARWVAHGAELGGASLWLAPQDRHTCVRNGRFELSGVERTAPEGTPSLGRLLHSLRVEFGSRVFAVVVDEHEHDSPTLRLLAQRGATIVSPLEYGAHDIARHLSSTEIVDLLGAALGTTLGTTAGKVVIA